MLGYAVAVPIYIPSPSSSSMFPEVLLLTVVPPVSLFLKITMLRTVAKTRIAAAIIEILKRFLLLEIRAICSLVFNSFPPYKCFLLITVITPNTSTAVGTAITITVNMILVATLIP